ncbi:bacillithiol biosynthesis BshC [bacterium]|nr:bacillithiol biosynthesis BshC [bacterium]
MFAGACRVSAPRVVTEPVGGGALTRAALDGSAPRGWFAPRPRGAEQWTSHAESVRDGFAGAGWLDALRPALQLSGAAHERMARVAAGNGIVVTTGQQPGLFGGPGYTWLKAMSALALADRLERELGIPVAPVFWAASARRGAGGTPARVSRGRDGRERVRTVRARDVAAAWHCGA